MTSRSTFLQPALRKISPSIFSSTKRSTYHGISIRGGENDQDDDNNNDEERYSRQLYTLGVRAHKLVRSTNVLLDGPFSSGLTFECGKNLALSGVGGIILVREDDDETIVERESEETTGNDTKDTKAANRMNFLHKVYHNENLDDLGKAYQNAAKHEILLESSAKEQLKSIKKEGKTQFQQFLLMEYLRRLNPSLRISVVKRSELEESQDAKEKNALLGDNPVLMCIDRPQSSQLLLNSLCRDLKIPFVAVESRGVYGRAFCDFGNDFYVVDEDGETPRNTLLERVEILEANDGIDDNNQIVEIHCVDGEKHDVSKGDTIKFDLGTKNSDTDSLEFKVLKVKSPTLFTAIVNDNNDQNRLLDFIESSHQSHQTKTFSRIKVPKHRPFLSMEDALNSCLQNKQNLFAASDLDKSFDETRRVALMNSFTALDSFVNKFDRLPKMQNDEDNANDIQEFQSIAETMKEDVESKLDKSKWNKIATSFAKCAAATLTPVQALMGALGAQEALKASSGLYNPIQQFLLYDCDEILHLLTESNEEDSVSNDGFENDLAPGQSYILGPHTTATLASQQLFVVGSGAIGCEILKNLSAMAAATSDKGSISLTDMDTIERSNLSRQLLFRDADVGKFKSSAAEEAIKRFNPHLSIEVHTNKVGDDAVGPFDDHFWSKKTDVVLNALDNVEARLFIDKKCVENRKGMIDAGTLGSKGNMQVVVPMQSESYGSSVDPPEPAIPVCTLKNFPYEISHTIQWGRDLFDGLFIRRPGQVDSYWESLKDDGVQRVGKSILEKLGEDAALTLAEELSEDIWFDFATISDDDEEEMIQSTLASLKELSSKWALRLAERLFRESIITLLRQHPKDSSDEDGIPFWSGTRRCPKVLNFDASSDEVADPIQTSLNHYLVEFITSATRLRMENYLPEKYHSLCKLSEKEAISLLKTMSDEKKYDNKDQEGESSVLDNVVSLLQTALKNFNAAPYIKVAEFEKDDDSNDHVTFVTAASNLRAMIYSINPTSNMETRRIAGKIVPAMITTTALVSALSCIEMLKLIMKYPLNLHRNAFVNLALPFFAFTQPLPAEEFQGLNGETHTLWDRIVIKEKKKHVVNKENDKEFVQGMTMRQFLKLLKKKIGSENEVTTISFGPYMIYANFLHEDDTSVLDQSIWNLVKETIISGDDIDEFEFDEGITDELDDNDSNGFRDVEKDLTEDQMNSVRELEEKSFLEFSVVAEEEDTGEEVEIPPVRILKWKPKA